MRWSRSALSSSLLLIALLLLALTAATVQAQTFTGVGSWTQQSDYGSSSTTPGVGGMAILGVSCVTDQGYAYCFGGQNSTGTDLSDVFYAQLSSSGSIGPWTETTDYGATSGTSGKGGTGIEWPSCVESNSYVYCVAGATNSGIVSKVYYAQLTSSGVGAWTETTDYGAPSGDSGSGGIQSFQLACVAYNGYIYCTGGGPSKVFYAQLSSSGVGPWTETTDYGAASGDKGTGGVPIDSNACVESSGDIYCIGGTSTSYAIVSDVFYAPLSSSGVGPWTETTDYGATSGSSGKGGVPIYGTSCTTTGTMIICVAGDTTGNTGTAGVYYAMDGGLGEWFPSAAFAAATYWLNCVQNTGYNNIYCWGGASNQGYSAPLLTGTTSTSSSSSTTTTPSAPSSSTTISSSTTSTTTSTTSTTSTSTTSTTSTTSSTTTPVPTSSSSDLDLIIGVAVVVIAVAGGGFFLWTRGRGEKPPPDTAGGQPPTTPPTSEPPQQTQSHAPPPSPLPKCGPDITDFVLGSMLNLMNDFFHSWGPKTQETQLGYLTRLPRPNDDLPNFNNAWDINELAPPDVGADGKVDPNKPSGYIATLKPYEEGCMQPKYPCYPSVMFLNNCHHPQVVNYVEWGVLARLNEWKKNGSATSYGETWFSTLHNERSGYSSLRGGDITGEADEARAMMGMPPAEPQLTDPNYPDQVAMANVGWKLADDYIALMNQKVQCKLANVNQQALEALLEMYQNKERVMAKCLKGCGKYHSTFARDVCFQYIFGEVHGDYIQLSKL